MEVRRQDRICRYSDRGGHSQMVPTGSAGGGLLSQGLHSRRCLRSVLPFPRPGDSGPQVDDASLPHRSALRGRRHIRPESEY